MMKNITSRIYSSMEPLCIQMIHIFRQKAGLIQEHAFKSIYIARVLQFYNFSLIIFYKKLYLLPVFPTGWSNWSHTSFITKQSACVKAEYIFLKIKQNMVPQKRRFFTSHNELALNIIDSMDKTAVRAMLQFEKISKTQTVIRVLMIRLTMQLKIVSMSIFVDEYHLTTSNIILSKAYHFSTPFRTQFLLSQDCNLKTNRNF